MTTDQTAYRAAVRPYRLAAGLAVAIALLVIAAGISDPEGMSLLSEGMVLLMAPTIVVGAIIAHVATQTHSASYRWGVRAALATTFVLFLIIGVGGFLGSDSDHPADLFYIVIPTVGITGAILARFQPRGMAHALLATALAQMVVPVITAAYFGRQGPQYSLWIWILNGFFVASFVGSVLLFRDAARKQLRAAAGLAG